MSRYIPGIPHFVFVKSLKETDVEEAIPEGPKRNGWAGVRHAIATKWIVRRGKGD